MDWDRNTSGNTSCSWLSAKKVSWTLFTQTVCTLRFFHHHTLHCNWMIEYIPYPRHEEKLPIVLSPAEVAAVFAATRNFKHRTVLMTIYAARSVLRRAWE
jgi:integrase/recombinase XerD